MKYALMSLFAVSSAAVACGSSPTPLAATSPATTTASEGHVGHKESHRHDHAALTPPLKDFHGVLAPVWHTNAGAARVEKACTNSKAMQEKATATSDAELVAATKDLDAACAKDGKSEVEAKLEVVHERFHAVSKLEKH